MLNSIGIPGLIIILVIILIMFGPSKLPKLGRSIGESMKNFKDSTKGVLDDEEDNKKEEKM
ncbi:twin-arginine translocase TatA/TatE family subunit [Lysinibacillus sp. SGAir0095]|uniref:twin-arginine translocase TatA/TatE family subunit n=1 Tax=Lysinibacillus sp. SGAir0095 TaxID=2070463 RepID=UPI0010CD149A|nr:twin-arginine translocase TatA/TatE family subunit [Lysinibacillus sp. SGAir0095]QCR32788.1 twin-arginine translocase TatA/TatE family subunit [Lysinibacillus sp. SGAir0095]